MPVSPLTLTPGWYVSYAQNHPVGRLAVRELGETLRQLGAPEPSGGTGPRIRLEHGEAGDGFGRLADADGLTLRGEGPNGLLYAVYDLLEDLGCRWVAPDAGGTLIPRLAEVALPTAPKRDAPALPGRCLIIGHDIFLAQAPEWIRWAARNRLNRIFVHTTPHDLALGACRLGSYEKVRRDLLPLLEGRGMTLELGGHHLSALVPRAFFKQDPSAFRFDGKKRTPDANFCPSSPRALTWLREHGRAFFLRYPEAEVYHLWPDDLPGGGWCRCEQCAADSPADQALRATNALAEALAQVNPHAKLSFLSYYDTQTPPSRVRPAHNVIPCLAPRLRSYAHGVADPASEVNRGIWRDWLRTLDRFGHGEAQVFEYYLDGLLFKSALPPLGEVMAADLRAHRGAGVHTVQVLLTGDRPWLSVPPNAYQFARLAWNPDADPAEWLRAFARVRAPGNENALLDSYAALADAWKPVLDFAPGETALSLDTAGRLDWVANPVRDVLDYMVAPQPLRERRLKRMNALPAALARGIAIWVDLRAAVPGEWQEFRAAEQLLLFLWRRQRLYVLYGRGAPKPDIARALKLTRAPLAASNRWGAVHLRGARTLANHALIRSLAGLQLDHIYDLRLAMPWQRILLRLRVHAKLLHLTRTIGRR